MRCIDTRTPESGFKSVFGLRGVVVDISVSAKLEHDMNKAVIAVKN